MDEQTSQPRAGNGSVDLGLQKLLHQAQEKLRGRGEEYQEAVRQSPGKAVLLAAAAGYLLPSLPLSLFLRGAIGGALLLTRPALMVYGGAKIYQWLREQDRMEGMEEPELEEPPIPRPGFS